MLSRPRLPARFPIGTKYVLDGRGPFVRRYIEFPNGRRVQLATRKALSCTCVASQPIDVVRTITTGLRATPRTKCQVRSESITLEPGNDARARRLL